VAHQVTLDVCNADFPSEAQRTARYQQIARAPGDTRIVSNENVTYDSEASATQALAEVRAAVEDCPRDMFLHSKVAGVPPLRFQLQLVADDQLGEVTPDHVALAGSVSDQSGKTQPTVELFQRRGNVMVGVYGRDLQTIKSFVGTIAKRLAGLTSAEAGE